jgi:hypothetical protein
VIELEAGPRVEIAEGRQGDRLLETTGGYPYRGLRRVRTGYSIVRGTGDADHEVVDYTKRPQQEHCTVGDGQWFRLPDGIMFLKYISLSHNA